MNKVRTYYRYWGKAEKDGARFHLLPYHCLDVAAVVFQMIQITESWRMFFVAKLSNPRGCHLCIMSMRFFPVKAGINV